MPTPANGQTYDLGAHVIDQSLVLFGRPARISAQIENIRGLGSPEVDDNVSPLSDTVHKINETNRRFSSLSSCTTPHVVPLQGHPYSPHL